MALVPIHPTVKQDLLESLLNQDMKILSRKGNKFIVTLEGSKNPDFPETVNVEITLGRVTSF